MLYPNGSTTRPRVTSAFGPRNTGISGASSFHRGADVVGFSTVRAIADGKVVIVGVPSGWVGGGYQVWVQHNGCFSRYCHMVTGSAQVRVGQSVKAGQALGTMGRTGTASGVHLHYEITPGNWHTLNEGQVDPMVYISSRLSSSDVLAQQKFLNTLGLGLEEDGIPGPKTADATGWFQKHAGLVVDKVWGPITDGVAKLVKAGKKTVSRSTKDIQDALRKAGCFMDHWKSDGQWGNQCSFGTYILQRKRNLTKDAIYGPASDASLFPAAPTPDPKPDVLDPAAPWKNFPADSALATWVGSPNYNNGSLPPAKKKIFVEHWFGSDATLAGTDAHFQDPATVKNGRGTGPSSQYGIGADGTAHQYVREQDYAHTNGHAEANAISITFEHEGGPGKPVTDACYEKSIKIHADAARRNGVEKLEWMVNVFPHSHWVATQCPGTLDIDRIITGTNKLLGVTTDPADELVQVRRGDLEKAQAAASVAAQLVEALD